ncbi:DEAD/DEAH box helicase [Hathewaya histolytica]|uniref:ATP-dependent RNA helicase CshA n=1 Tax=Hathewaya histolytica TaxID=1498 RepID=A0A4U9RTN2_HATHI|nr:DEAD/DEAH box helicase [Hathewaya histolytica]VTQ95804.1 DEAD/DEAH box helicase [Hathewaya histolytica]
MEKNKFYNLGLKAEVLKAIDYMGFTEPSQIQEQVIPVLLQGEDVIGQAQTGTGKTLAFGAPMLNNLVKSKGQIKSIVLAPTRELAIQVSEELSRISKYMDMELLAVYGGYSIEKQIRAIKRGVDIIVGTPGRVLDLIRRKVINLSYVDFLILDEADEMLNMGFIQDIEDIVKNCKEDRQTLLFSATMPKEIKNLAKRYMKKDAKHIAVVKKSMTVSSVEQYYFEVKPKKRFEAFCRIIDVDNPEAAIIFCKTKRGVDELVESMQSRGYSVEGMHGDMSQNQRMNTLRKFKEGNLKFLVATDVAARGIDVENVTHVINYDLPQDVESYVHRIGRTGRANKQGVAYTIVTGRELGTIRQIEKHTKGKIDRKDLPKIEDIFNSKCEDILNRVYKNIETDDYKKFLSVIENSSEKISAENMAAALMSLIYNKEVSFDYTEDIIEDKANYVRLFLTVGRIDKLSPKKLLEFIDENSGIGKEHIGTIDILEKFSFINVQEDVVKNIITNCSGKKFLGRKLKIEVSTKSKKR